MKKTHTLLLFFICCIIVLHSKAAKITVTSALDSIPGSLRHAIEQAQSGDTIDFDPSLTGSTITLTNGAFIIDKTLVIIGLGEHNLSLSGNDQFALFKITPDGNLSLSGVTITKGEVKRFEREPGGAVYNEGVFSAQNITITRNGAGGLYNLGTLTLSQTSITNNHAYTDLYPGGAGAINNTGTAIFNECTIDNNRSYSYYLSYNGIGGISNSGTMKIYNSTISRNYVIGISNSGTIDLINSTVSNNNGGGKSSVAGGISNRGILKMEYCTIAHNISDNGVTCAGSGIINEHILSAKGCIIAQNGPQYTYETMKSYIKYNEGHYYDGTVRMDVLNEPSGQITDLGFNLVGIDDDEHFKNSTNKTGNRFFPLDPLIGPLQNNGGLTETHALLEGSPCINRGLYSGTVSYDQRGVKRFRPDIGAYEFIHKPGIAISEPINGSVFTSLSDILIKAELINEDPLLIISNTSGYKKLKIGFDSTGLYQGSRNVLAGGNTQLEITLKDFNGTTEWNKLQVRPNGNGVNQIPLSKYIDPIGGIGEEFTTITIPLSDFKGVDFSKLTLLELPYSNNAKPYKIGIKTIAFTGGTTPFLWFGGTQINNNFTGSGTGGDLLAYILPATSPDYISKVEFYNGNTKLGEDFTAPYSITWEEAEEGEHTLKAIALSEFGDTISSLPVQIKVAPEVYVTNSRTGTTTNEGFAFYPNPVSGKITLSSEYYNAEIVITDINGTVSYQGNYEQLDGKEIDLSSLTPGIYFIKIENQDKQVNKVMKLVKI
jgi:hypothetical protein